MDSLLAAKCSGMAGEMRQYEGHDFEEQEEWDCDETF